MDLLEAVFNLDPNDPSYDDVSEEPEDGALSEGSGPPSDSSSNN